MRKVIRFASIFFLIIVASILIFSFSDKYKIGVIKNNIECTVIAKCNDDARAIDVIDNSIYVAYPHSVKVISQDGRVKKLFDVDENIDDIVCLSDRIYVISDSSIYEYNNSKVNVLLSNIPSGNNDIKHKILVSGDKILFTVPAKTNSGVYDDNSLEKIATFEDEAIGTASVYSVNVGTRKIELYAMGIRGIKGIDISSEGKIYAIFSGMNNKGVRPVCNDTDYIYEIKEKKNYGWPNYSGGDQIDSPRFARDKLIEFIGEHEVIDMDKPVFVANSLGELEELGVYKWNKILPKDSIIYVNTLKNEIEAIVNKKYKISLLRLIDKSNIKDITVKEGKIILLDSGANAIYSINSKNDFSKGKVSIEILVYLFILVLAIIMIIMFKKRKADENE